MEDRHANKGYVPITYLKAYQQPPQQSTAENNTTNNTTTNTITTTAQLEKVNEEESWFSLSFIWNNSKVWNTSRIFFQRKQKGLNWIYSIFAKTKIDLLNVKISYKIELPNFSFNSDELACLSWFLFFDKHDTYVSIHWS